MFDYLRNAALYIVAGAVINGCAYYINSSFLIDFLKDNLILLLVALLAINTTTMSVIMTKLREITDKNQVDFSRSIRSMRESIVEQVILIVLATAVLIALGSPYVTAIHGMVFALNTLLVSILVYSIHILYDTANGIFVILKHENNEGG